MDWVRGHAKLGTWESTIATAKNLLQEWWSRGVDQRRSVADWALHIFREHNKEADFWAGKGVKGSAEEWIDTADVIWSGVAGLCGFWDGSCERRVCGAGTTIQVFTTTMGRVTNFTKCGPVPGWSSLDAELGG